MKLEFKHITPYLPYGLKIKYNDSKDIWGIGYHYETDYEEMLYPLSTLIFTMESQTLSPLGWKPILKPLTDLTTLIHKDEKDCTYSNWISAEYDIEIISFIELWGFEKLPFEVVDYLLEHHFDVYGLIEKGLALDHNNKNP